MDESSKALDVGLDVHKESIAVAYAPLAERGAEVVSPGAIGRGKDELEGLSWRPASRDRLGG